MSDPLDVLGQVSGQRVSWPLLDDAALHGITGRIVSYLKPETEADPAAILLTILCAAGNAIGPAPGVYRGPDYHSARLYVVIVGKTAQARKGMSLSEARRVMRIAAPEWERERIVPAGLSSGEGLVWEIRDPIRRMEEVETPDPDADPDAENVNTVIEMVEKLVDPGATDKRLFVPEKEFASALTVMTRRGNTLSAVVRELWDSGESGKLTKNSPARTSNAHVSIVGHITVEELRRNIRHEIANGFANRFLFTCARRQRFLPHGGNVDMARLADYAEILGEAIDAASRIGTLSMDGPAMHVWEDAYPGLVVERTGILGAITARAEAQALRLAVTYALLDARPDMPRAVIREPHVAAALAVWTYCLDSASFVFSDAHDPLTERVLDGLRRAGAAGLTRNQIREDVLQRHVLAADLDDALAELVRTATIVATEEPTAGRTATRYSLAEYGGRS